MTPTNRRVHLAAAMPRDESGEPSLPSPAAPQRTPSRFMSALRTAFGAAFVVAASLGVAWFARRHVTQSPRFAVTSVQVIGNGRRLADEIIAESGLVLGANVFSVDLDSARARVLGDPWIADASITRRLPGTILVQVTERTPAALVAIGDVFLASADGEPFKKLEPGDPVDLPLITGMTPENVVEDRVGALRAVRRGIDLAAEYEHGALAKRAPLEEVHIDAGSAFTLVVGHQGMALVLGGPPFRRKLDEAVRVVAELERRRTKADAIMLDNEARPERVVVRMR